MKPKAAYFFVAKEGALIYTEIERLKSMRGVIDKILDGKFEYERGEIAFSDSRIEITLQAGEDYQGSFFLYGRKDDITTGYIYSSDSRMECLTTQFYGTSKDVDYIFHGKGMETGDVLQGSFYIVSNKGEYELPFVVMAERKTMATSLGPLKNLFHFANLAKSSWAEAVQLFYQPGFEEIFDHNDLKYKELYKGLSKYYGNERNVEEFLIAVNKKQKVNYIIDEDRLCLSDLEEDIGDHEVLITKNGWGYSNLQVEVSGGFLSVEKAVLTDDDFPGNRCKFCYHINRAKLHKGFNYGSLRFYNHFMERVLPIEVKIEDEEYRQDLPYRKKKELLVKMMDCYGEFRMKKMATKAWLSKNHELVDEWETIDAADALPKLYRTHLLLTEGSNNEAVTMLDQAHTAVLQSKDMDKGIWCYYLYLTTLYGKDENYVNQIAKEVSSAYEKDETNWRLGWLLLYLDPEYDASYAKKWMFIKRQFERGCISPVFYMEALLLLRAEPALLTGLGEFEIQLLRYAVKYDVLTGEVNERFRDLLRQKQPLSAGLLDLLKKSYEKKPDIFILSNICTLLIRGDRRGIDDFRFYAVGVEKDLRITKLYEYYMYSLDMETLMKLPEEIYLYFAYHNNLEWERIAYLYASLLCYREELPELYEKKFFSMQEFVVKMIRKGFINKHLAFLYKEMITGDVMLEETDGKLASLLFSVHVETPDARMRKLIILYAKEKAERSVTLTDGQAVVSIYGEDYTLLLEDGAGNRYVPREGFAMQRLFTSDALLAAVQERDFQTLPLQLYLCGTHVHNITSENIRRYERILASDEVTADYKQTILPDMVKFYYDHDRTEELDDLLEKISPALLDAGGRGELLHYLTVRDKLETAEKWIKKYGVNGMDPKMLQQFGTKMIRKLDEAEDKELVDICFYAFRHGRADAVTLAYLAKYYEGGTRVLRDIWKSAKEKGVDVHEFSERILVQILYSGSYVGEIADIFGKAIECDTDLSLEKAFLCRCAYDYFVKDRITDSIIFEEIGRFLGEEEGLPRVCVLAYAKYYAENRYRLRQEMEQTFADCLSMLVKEGIILQSFLICADICPALRPFAGRTIVEYRAKSGGRAVLYYMVWPEDEDYQKAEMREIYGGVFCSMFVLFFGEKLFYYVAEEKADGSKPEITCSNTISGSDFESDAQGSRFRILNDIVTAEALQDYDTVDQMLAEYERTDIMQKELFKLCR